MRWTLGSSRRRRSAHHFRAPLTSPGARAVGQRRLEDPRQTRPHRDRQQRADRDREGMAAASCTRFTVPTASAVALAGIEADSRTSQGTAHRGAVLIETISNARQRMTFACSHILRRRGESDWATAAARRAPCSPPHASPDQITRSTWWGSRSDERRSHGFLVASLTSFTRTRRRSWGLSFAAPV